MAEFVRTISAPLSAVRLQLFDTYQRTFPRIRQQQEDLSSGLWGLHRLHSRAAGVPYCGANFAYSNLTEWRGSAEMRAGRTFKEFSSIELQ